MPTVTAIAGLPGSGKSELINREFNRPATGVYAHDFYEGAPNNSEVRDSLYYGKVVEALRAGRDCVIADIVFTLADRREAVERTIRYDVPGTEVEWVFFENDLPQCILNILGSIDTGRNWQRRIEAAIFFSAHYTLPPGMKPRRVCPAFHIVRSAIPSQS